MSKSDVSYSPLVGELRVEGSPPADTHDADLDLVVVHGLHRATANSPTLEGHGLTKSLQADFPTWTGTTVRLMTYDCLPTNLSPWKIHREASNLLSSLQTLRPAATGETKTKGVSRPIIFICQDIGGLIVKAALIQAASTPQLADTIAASVRGLVFVACPHRHEGLGSLQRQLLGLLQGSGLDLSNQSLPALAQNLVDTVEHINGQFIHTKLLLSSVCVSVFSTVANPGDQVFDEYTATLNTPFETVIGSNSPHAKLAESLFDTSSQACKTFSEVARKSWTYDNVQTARSMALLRTLATVASPVYPLEEVPDVDTTISGCRDRLDEFNATTNNQILHIRTKTDAEALLLTRRVIKYISNSDSRSGWPVFHFTFQRSDVRFNNIRSMLATLLAQLAFNNIYNNGYYVMKILLDTNEYRGWATDDLLAIWRRFRLNEMDDKVIYVLGSIDQCDKSRQDFLYWLKFMAAHTEMPFKVIITTTAGKDSDIEEALVSCPSDVYRTVDVSAQGGFRSILSPELPPRYMHFEPQLARLLDQVARSDLLLHQATIDWLKCTHLALKDIEVVLGRLGATKLAGGLETLLGLIPTERQIWSRRLLAFACASVRPLRVMELCAASHIAGQLLPDTYSTAPNGSNAKPPYLRDHLDDILQWLGGLLVVRNDEFHLRSPSLRDALRCRPERAETRQHRDILDVCTAYIRQSPRIVNAQTGSIEKPGLPKDPPSFGLVSLADAMPYATEYWAQHYKLLRATPDFPESSIAELDVRASEFLRAEDAFQDPLLASAELGLSHLARDFFPSASSSRQLRESALMAAAKRGHVEVIKTFLESSGNNSFKVDFTVLVEATRVASLSENAEAFRFLVQQLSEAQSPDPRPPIPPTLVFRAAWLGLDSTVEVLLGLGLSATPDGLDDNISPLHAAVVFDRVETLKVLIRGGGDVTAKTSARGQSPLHYACDYGSSNCAEELLSRSDLPGIISELNGRAPLSHAVEAGNVEVAEILLKHDKHYRKRTVEDCKEEYGAALYHATSSNRRLAVQLLLRYGADPNFVLPSFISPLQRAIWNGRADICTLLVVEGKANVNDGRGGWIPLIIATEQDDTAVVSLLLDHGAAVEVDAKRSAIHVAASSGRTKVIQTLLAAHANIDARDESSNTAIWLAARNDHADAVDILARAKADVNATSSWNNWTPLHVAYDLPAVTRVLLHYEVDVDNIDSNGYTALRLATQFSQPEVVRLLLAKGASLEKSTRDGETCFAYAVRSGQGNVEVLRALLEAGEDVNQPIGDTFALEYAIQMVDSAMVELLLEFSPDLGRRNSVGNAFLHCITKDTPVRSVQRLVNAGADPNAEDRSGHAVLCAAIKCRNVEVVGYLLQSRAVNRHAITHQSSALFGGIVHHAAQSSSVDVLRLLVEVGEDMTAVSGLSGGPVATACYPLDDSDGDSELVNIIRYLVNETKVDVRAKGGVLGCAINMAASSCGPQVIGILLAGGARLDDTDGYGRAPIHLACQNQLQALEALKVPDDEFKRKDRFGRLPLHFAALSGCVDLARHVLERSRRVGIEIDAVDRHGWTALMWAARTPTLWPEKPNANKSDHERVIKFFLDEKADASALGEVDGGQWTPLEIATYHAASDKVISLLSAKPPHSAPHSGSSRKTRVGVEQTTFCDGCLMFISGYYHCCLSCGLSDLCFKCYQSKELHECQNWVLKGEELTVDDVVENTTQSPYQGSDDYSPFQHGERVVEDGMSMDYSYESDDDLVIEADGGWLSDAGT